MKMKQTVMQTIRAYFEQFNNTEKKIANFILNNQNNIADVTIQDLAESTSTSTATISRFVKKIGYPSFRDFSISLAASTTVETADFFGEVSDNDDAKSVIQKVFIGGANALSETANHLKSKDFEKVVDWFENADEIGFFGIGGSSMVAFDAYHKFLRTPLKVISHPDYDIQLMQAVRFNKNNIGVVISHSGRNKDTLLIADKLKESGAKVVAITSFAESPLALRSDLVLNSLAEEVNFRNESMSSLLAQITIVDALFTLYGVRNSKKTQKILDRIRPSIEDTRL